MSLEYTILIDEENKKVTVQVDRSNYPSIDDQKVDPESEFKNSDHRVPELEEYIPEIAKRNLDNPINSGLAADVFYILGTWGPMWALEKLADGDFDVVLESE